MQILLVITSEIRIKKYFMRKLPKTIFSLSEHSTHDSKFYSFKISCHYYNRDPVFSQ